MPITHKTVHDKLIKKWHKDPKFQTAYIELSEEFDLFDQMLKARKSAGLTQEDVATRMGTKVPAIARLEASGGTHRHSPTLETLRKYAQAVGCQLVIQLKGRIQKKAKGATLKSNKVVKKFKTLKKRPHTLSKQSTKNA